MRTVISTSRQSLRAATTARSSPRAQYRLICVLLIAIFLLGLYVTGSRLPQRLAYFRSQGRFSDQKLKQFTQSASNQLQNCNAHPRSTVCKWAKKQSRANRQRPNDWSPKPGWPEDLEITGSLRHSSDRALTALGKAGSPSLSSRQSLQSVLQSLWLTQSNPDMPIIQQSSLPQCSALYSQPCIALIDNANVSSRLQPELQGCSVVKHLTALTTATCAESADVWVVNTASGQTLAAMANDMQCSTQQVLARTRAIWYVGGQQDNAVQLHNQDASSASIAAVHVPDSAWQQQYSARPSAAEFTEPMQPSLIWTALMTLLECAQPDATLYYYAQAPAVQASAMHDVVAESDLFARLHASGLIVLHEDCASNVPCIAMPGMISQLPEEGLLAAPGIKLYMHRKKWKDSSMKVYEDSADGDDEESA